MNLDPLALVVEDDPAIRRIVKNLLVEVGCQVEFAITLEGGISLAASLQPDLILLDLGLPDGEGHLLIQALAAPDSPPILVLSARGAEAEKVRALEAGAVDYITKPFGPGELKARIRVALRQSRPQNEPEKLTFGNLLVDADARRVFQGSQEIHLTPLEYKLLLVMARNAGKILTTNYLLKEVWGHDNEDQRHYVRVLTAGLRKKLEPDPARPQFIHTESGVGYRFHQ